jgi:hypothetical protein
MVGRRHPRPPDLKPGPVRTAGRPRRIPGTGRAAMAITGIHPSAGAQRSWGSGEFTGSRSAVSSSSCVGEGPRVSLLTPAPTTPRPARIPSSRIVGKRTRGPGASPAAHLLSPAGCRPSASLRACEPTGGPAR